MRSVCLKLDSLIEELQNLRRLNEENHVKLSKDLDSKSQVVAQLSEEVTAVAPNKQVALFKAPLGPTHKSESFVDNRWRGSGGPKRKPSKTRTRWSSSVNTRSQTWWRWWKSTRSARRSYAGVVHLNNVVATSVVVLLSSRTSMIGSSKGRTRSSARTRRVLHTCSRWYGADRPAQVLANGSVINCCT